MIDPRIIAIMSHNNIGGHTTWIPMMRGSIRFTILVRLLWPLTLTYPQEYFNLIRKIKIRSYIMHEWDFESPADSIVKNNNSELYCISKYDVSLCENSSNLILVQCLT